MGLIIIYKVMWKLFMQNSYFSKRRALKLISNPYFWCITFPVNRKADYFKYAWHFTFWIENTDEYQKVRLNTEIPSFEKRMQYKTALWIQNIFKKYILWRYISWYSKKM